MSEQNTKDFIIQHSLDGIKWNTAAIVAAAGNSSSLRNYAFVDNNTGKGYNYYRVMQTELNGNATYSELRVINLSGDYAPFTLLGNQVSNGVLQVEVHQTTVFSLYEVNGRLLWIRQFAAGLQSIDVSRYAKGIYLLRADAKTQKLLIQ